MTEEPEKKEFQYETKTDEEIKVLAMDTLSEKIFWATMIPKGESHMIGSVFMVLSFLDAPTLKALDAVSAIPYEYLSKAGERGVNGFPMFMSVQFLDLNDYNRMVAKYEQLKTAVAAV